MWTRHRPIALLGTLMVVLSGACGPSKWRPPLELAPDFQATRIDPIVVLPAVDARIDTSIAVELATQLGEDALPILRARGYPAALGAAGPSAQGLGVDALAVADAATIRGLGPPGARWVMVLALVDVTTSMGLGSSGNAELAGFLFDTQAGRLIWRDRGLGQVGQGGLLGFTLVAVMDEEAISAALKHLLASLPIQIPVSGAA